MRFILVRLAAYAFLLFVAFVPARVWADTPPTPLPLASQTSSRQPNVTVLTECASITAPGNYQLTTKLVANWDCIHIHASDVMLDCSGNSIEGKLFRGTGIIVESDAGASPRQNIEIKNCRIFHFLYGIAVEHGKAIWIHHNDLSDNFDDTHGTYQGVWLGLVDGGGLRMNFVESGRVEANTANRGANGLDARDSRRLILRENTTASNSAFGIVLTNTSDSVVEANTVKDNVRWCTFPTAKGDVPVPGCDSAGIMLQDGSSRNRVTNNRILGRNGDGIFLRNFTHRCGDDTVITKNQIVGALWNGIEAGFCDRIRITDNDFSWTKIGVWLSYMDGAVVQNNRFDQIANTGIVLKNLHHALISSNSISNGDEGVYLWGDTGDEKFGWTLNHPFAYYRSYANIVTGNAFTNLARSVHLSDSTANQISNNRFTNTPAGVVEETSK